jgi:hypothetical protein
MSVLTKQEIEIRRQFQQRQKLQSQKRQEAQAKTNELFQSAPPPLQAHLKRELMCAGSLIISPDHQKPHNYLEQPVPKVVLSTKVGALVWDQVCGNQPVPKANEDRLNITHLNIYPTQIKKPRFSPHEVGNGRGIVIHALHKLTLYSLWNDALREHKKDFGIINCESFFTTHDKPSSAFMLTCDFPPKNKKEEDDDSLPNAIKAVLCAKVEKLFPMLNKTQLEDGDIFVVDWCCTWEFDLPVKSTPAPVASIVKSMPSMPPVTVSMPPAAVSMSSTSATTMCLD